MGGMDGSWDDWATGFAADWPEQEPMEEFFDGIDYATTTRGIDDYSSTEFDLVFVVGTFKKGYKNHRHLGSDAMYGGKFYTDKYFEISRNETDEPIVIPGNDSILGELYRISGEQLKELDGIKSSLTRSKIEIHDEKGTTRIAWLYHSPEGDSLANPDNQIEIRRVKEGHLEYIA